jgi:hypothetical protein
MELRISSSFRWKILTSPLMKAVILRFFDNNSQELFAYVTFYLLYAVHKHVRVH